MADEIRTLIESGELESGQRISPALLAERLSVSRTPVRDALQALKTEGLVDVRPRVGVFVRGITEHEARDVYQIKTAVEPLAAAWAATRGSNGKKQHLAIMLEALTEAADLGDVRASAAHVDAIHLHLFEMSGSDALLDVYKVIGGRVKVLRYLNMAQPGRLENSVRQHTDIVDAVVDGDAERAAETMRRHTADALESVARVLRGRDNMSRVGAGHRASV